MTKIGALLVVTALTFPSATSACGSPAPLPAKAEAPRVDTSSRPSGAGGACFVSMVLDPDGKPSTEQRCEPGLTCDYSQAVPDGAGRCVAAITSPPEPAATPTSSAEPQPPEPATPPPIPQKQVIALAGASKDYELWSPTAADIGPNRQRRLAAEKALTAYYATNRTTAESAKHVVEAAYAIAKMKQAALDPGYRAWFKSAVAAWDGYKAAAPQTDGKSEAQQSPYVDYAAEAAVTLLDERITAEYDAPARHTYGPTIEDVFGEVAIEPKTHQPVQGPDGRLVMKKKGRYQLNAAEAERWDRELEAIEKKYDSREWIPVVIERQGRLYDALRSGLASAASPSSPPASPSALAFWRQKRQLELDGADQVMVKRYATAVALGQSNHAKDERLKRAVGRLGHYTDVIGDDVIEKWVVSTPDPRTRGATKLTYRSRQYVQAP